MEKKTKRIKWENTSKFFLIIAIIVQSSTTIYSFFDGEDPLVTFLFFVSSALLIWVYQSDYKK